MIPGLACFIPILISHCHYPAPIPVLLVISHQTTMTGKLNNARDSTAIIHKIKLQPNLQKIHKQCQRKQYLVGI